MENRRESHYFAEQAINPMTPQIADFRKLILENTKVAKGSQTKMNCLVYQSFSTNPLALRKVSVSFELLFKIQTISLENKYFSAGSLVYCDR